MKTTYVRTYQEVLDRSDSLQGLGWAAIPALDYLHGEFGVTLGRMTHSGVQERTVLWRAFGVPLHPRVQTVDSVDQFFDHFTTHAGHMLYAVDTDEHIGVACYCTMCAGSSYILRAPKTICVNLPKDFLVLRDVGSERNLRSLLTDA